jgi:hypothetical protein
MSNHVLVVPSRLLYQERDAVSRACAAVFDSAVARLYPAAATAATPAAAADAAGTVPPPAAAVSLAAGGLERTQALYMVGDRARLREIARYISADIALYGAHYMVVGDRAGSREISGLVLARD